MGKMHSYHQNKKKITCYFKEERDADIFAGRKLKEWIGFYPIIK
jgi:hypothetical protein